MLSVSANSNSICSARFSRRAYDASNVRIGGDVSDGDFTVEVVRVTYPNGGQTLYSGDSVTITWHTNTTAVDVASTKVIGRCNGDDSWVTLGKPRGNPEQFTLTIPDPGYSRDRCKVQIVLRDAAGASLGKDVSDQYFAVNR